MKKLSILTLLLFTLITNGQANNRKYFLFTDTQREVQDSTTKDNPATWIIDFEKSIITVQTETEDRVFSFTEYQKVKSIEDNIIFDKYILESGGCIYIDTDISEKAFLQVIYTTENKQFIFRTN